MAFPTTVDGRFSILCELGRGGMGVVYKARQSGLDRYVALKVLSIATEKKDVARFEREAHILSSLNHRNIATFCGYGFSESGQPYYFTEFLEGTDLDKFLAQTSVPIERSAKIFLEMCEGLHHAHLGGVIHRDLKPSNVIVCTTSDGKDLPKLVDFGLAKQILGTNENQKLTSEGATVGTIAYMSPEQCRGDETSASSDIYSLGCILYEILAGAPPFSKLSTLALMMEHVETDPPPISHPPEQKTLRLQLEKIAAKALEKRPSDRYSSVLEMRDEIAKALSCCESELAGSDSGAAVTSHPDSHEKLVVGSCACVALAMLLVVGYFLYGFVLPPQKNGVSRDTHDSPLHKNVVAGGNSVTVMLPPESLGELSYTSGVSFVPIGPAQGTVVLPKVRSNGPLVRIKLTKRRGVNLSGLANIPGLAFVDASDTTLSDEGLSSIIKFVPSLGGLELRGTDVTDAGVSKLAQVQNLQILDASFTHLHGQGLQHLNPLEMLSVNHDFELEPAALAVALNNQPQLHRLYLSNSPVSDDVISAISRMNALGVLAFSIGSSHANTHSLEALSKCRLLNTLIIEDSTIPVTGSIISGMKRLRDLKIARSIIGHDFIDAIRQLPTLKMLCLDGVTLTDGQLRQLLEDKALSDLSLAHSTVSNHGLSLLSTETNITNLDLEHTNVQDDDLILLIKKNRQIRKLNLEKDKVTDRGVKWLGQLPFLESLVLENTGITDAGLVSLSNCDALRYLNIKNTVITAHAIAAFQSKYPQCRIEY